MNLNHEFFQLAVEEGEDAQPFLLGCILVEGEGDQVALRWVADEGVLRAILKTAGRDWLLTSITRLCDGLKPPDDRPAGIKWIRGA